MSGPTGSAACPLCPQACQRNGQGKLRADRATQVISICPSWGVSSLTWAPLRRGFLLPESGPVACARIRRAPGFAASGGLSRARKGVIGLTGSQSGLFALLSIASASRAARLLSWSRRSTRLRGDRRHAVENHNCDSRAGAACRSLRLSVRAATRAAAGSCRSSPSDDECPFRTADGAAFGEAGATHRTNGKLKWLIVA